MKKFGFRKKERLSKQGEFERVRREGKSYRGTFTALYVLSVPGGENRIGFSVGKKAGGAVRRNRLKRLFREAYRLNKDRLVKGMDLLLVIRGKSGELNFEGAEKELLSLLKRAGVSIHE